MGEIADDHIDQMLFGGWRFPRPCSKWHMTCNRCGASGLKWRETKAGWRLYEDVDTMHKCSSSPPLSDDEFDVVVPPTPIVFVIRYRDPETDEVREVEQAFEDSHTPHFVSAQTWAEGYAYGLADKGWYEVEPKRTK